MPTVPPSNQPTTRTVTSTSARHSQIGQPSRAFMPVINPSRGPGPEVRPDVEARGERDEQDAGEEHADLERRDPRSGGTIHRTNCMLVPTSRMLAIVPTPGFCRSGIHSSRTRKPTMFVIQPMPMPVWMEMPWAKTVHGSTPRPASTVRAQPAP